MCNEKTAKLRFKNSTTDESKKVCDICEKDFQSKNDNSKWIRERIQYTGIIITKFFFIFL